MDKSYYYLLVWLLIAAVVRGLTASDCYNTPTSEGLITLPHLNFACAELKGEESPQDLGKNYVQCVHGNFYVLPCPAGLRWDTAINTCNFPKSGNCDLSDRSLDFPNFYDETTTERPRTTRSVKTSTTTEGSSRKYTSVRNRKTTKSRGESRTTTTLAEVRTTKSSRTTKDRSTTTARISTITTTELPAKTNRLMTENVTEKVVESALCFDVDTSEGPRTLRSGQMACASLGLEETESNLGGKFVLCLDGNVFTNYCPAELRYDTATGVCNWPDFSTCKLEAEIRSESRSIPFKPTSSTSSRKAISSDHTLHQLTSRNCNSDNCKLPSCFCLGDTPSAMAREEMPMFIMLTFDDALLTTLYNKYFRALTVANEFDLFNPNGCPIKSTFYVSHEYTDYTKVKAIWEAGNEIGSHTIHHKLPPGDKDSDYPQMVAEIQGMKDEIQKALRNKTLVDSIIGFRSPYLRVAGNVQFDVLKDFGFLYDTSMLNINIFQRMKPHWPFTLDYVIEECVNPPCPTKSYPGLWEVPLNGLIGDDKQSCSMVDSCIVGKSPWSATDEEWYSFYDRNFQDYFYPYKVPMPLFTHGSMFEKYPNSFPAMVGWFQNILQTHDDIWLMTPTQVIEWMKNPLSNREMIANKWGC